MTEYIEREALEKALTVAAANDKDKNRRTWAKAICVLHDLPTVDVAPVVHGRWIWDTNGLYPKPLCSKCRYEPYRRSNHNLDLPRYCPNCGAKMDGGAEND